MKKDMNTKERVIRFSWPDITEDEIKEIVDTLQGGWITTGPKTKQLEKDVARYAGTERAVCLNSATAAEELNLRILGVGEGDEVIVPAFTYTATVSAVIHVGATPIPVDCQNGHYEMDYDAVAKVVNEKTKAIFAVDLYGIPCDYDRLYQIAEDKKALFSPASEIQRDIGRIAIIADSAHSIGARRVFGPEREWKSCGQLADFTSFSFHAVKNVTTAEGGAAVWKQIPGVNDDDLYRLYMLYSLHGQSKDAFSKNNGSGWEYDVLGPWYKYNMTDILSSLGLVQLRRYPEMLKRRREIIVRYDRICDELGIRHLTHYCDEYESSGHLYITRTPWLDEEARNEVIQKMADRKISCNVHYKPLPLMTAYKKLGWKIEDFPNTYDYYHNLITLPLHTLLSDDDVEYVLDNFSEITEEYRAGAYKGECTAKVG